MKKVLFLIHDLGYGGAEKVLVNLVNNIDKKKYDVTLQTLFDVGPNRHFLKDAVHYIGGWKHMFRGNVTLMKAFSPKTLCRMLVNDEYDIVVSFLEGPCARILSSYEGKKVAWIHVEYNEKRLVAESFRSFDEAVNCYNSFDKVICVAETVKNSFLSYVDLTSPCEVLYNVNETREIIDRGLDKQELIDVNFEGFNIISVGRLSIGHKGFDRLINIHKRLLDYGVNNKLFIVGEGDDHAKLKKHIDENNLNNTCVLVGFDENPYKYVSKSDLFVCSSNKEGFSTAVTEALVLGIPVVSTDVSGAKELLGKNNEFGIVTKIEENALFEGVYRMLTEDGLLEYYKEKARKRGRDFSTELTTIAVENMLEKL